MKFLISVLWLVCATIAASAQVPDAKKATSFFEQFGTTNAIFNYSKANLLSLEECKELFKDDYAYIYQKKISAIVSKLDKTLFKDSVLSINLTTAISPLYDQSNKKVDVSKLKAGVQIYYLTILARKQRTIEYTPFVYINGKYKPLVGFKHSSSQ